MSEVTKSIESNAFLKREWKKVFNYKWIVMNIPFFLFLAGLAVGADGLMIEVHHDPDRAHSDGPQSLTHENFARLMNQVRAIANTREKPAELV